MYCGSIQELQSIRTHSWSGKTLLDHSVYKIRDFVSVICSVMCIRNLLFEAFSLQLLLAYVLEEKNKLMIFFSEKTHVIS